MKRKVLFIYLFSLELFQTPSQAQWTVIDTLYSSFQCTSSVAYPVTLAFVSNDSAYYYYNTSNCSPSTPSSHTLFRTSDSFLNWNYLLSFSYMGEGTNIWDMVFVTNNIGFLSRNLQSSFKFSKTTDAGVTWNDIYFGQGQPLVKDLFITNPDSGFGISNDGILYKYSNDTINLMDTINFTPCYSPKMFFTENNFGYILSKHSQSSEYYKVLRSVDGGANWSMSFIDNKRIFYDLSFFNDSIGYLASDTGLFVTYNAGISWSLMNTPFEYCISISIIKRNVIYAIGSGAVYRTVDGGQNWNQQIVQTDCYPISLKMINDSLGFMYARSTINYNNLVLKTINGGEVFVPPVSKDSSILTIEPNPTTDKFEISIPQDLENNTPLTIEIFSSDAKRIQKIRIESYQFKVSLNLEGESNGIYSIVVSNGEKKYVGRVLLSRLRR